MKDLSIIHQVPLLGKAEIRDAASGFVKNILDEGTTNSLDAYIAFRKIQEFIATALSDLEFSAMTEQAKYGKLACVNGVEVGFKQGYAMLDYGKDSEYARLSELLTKRKEQLNMAHKAGNAIIDEDGEQIERVPVKSYSKDSLTLKY